MKNHCDTHNSFVDWCGWCRHAKHESLDPIFGYQKVKDKMKLQVKVAGINGQEVWINWNDTDHNRNQRTRLEEADARLLYEQLRSIFKVGSTQTNMVSSFGDKRHYYKTAQATASTAHFLKGDFVKVKYLGFKNGSHWYAINNAINDQVMYPEHFFERFVL